MRLIDADELKKQIEVAMKDSGFYRPIYQGFAKAIDYAPTIDVEPARHGHWIEDDDGDGRHCSICGEDYCYLISNCELYNYCPNCGAKMDMEVTNDEIETVSVLRR